MPDETGYSLLRADIAAGFKHDDRIRALEVEQAESKAVLANIPKMEERLTTAQRESESRLMEAIRENRPKSPWAAVGAISAALAVILVLAAAIYSR